MKSKRDNNDNRKSPFEKKIRDLFDNPNEEESMRVGQVISFLCSIPDLTIEREMRDKFRNELNRRCWKVLHDKQKRGLF